MAGSKGGRGGQGGGQNLTLTMTATATNGDTLNLPIPLRYGDDDSGVSGTARQNIDAWEDKRRKAKIEYAYMLDANGNPVSGEIKGGSNSVRTPLYLKNRATVFTHIHPRGKNEEGVLGGTFSKQDLLNFAGWNGSTYRAAASEGTYSITKQAGFDKAGFNDFLSSSYDASLDRCRAEVRELGAAMRRGEITYAQYRERANDSFNRAVIEKHDLLIANQKKYGYNYTLERAKK